MILSKREYDAILLALVSLYAFSVLAFLAFDEDILQKVEALQYVFHAFELIAILLFLVEIGLHTIAFGIDHVKNPWVIADIVLLGVTALFVILDIAVTNRPVSNVIKLRGILRVVKMMILFWKLFDLSNKAKVDLKKKRGEMGFSKIEDVKDRTLSILKFIKENTSDFEHDLTWIIGKLLDGTLSEK